MKRKKAGVATAVVTILFLLASIAVFASLSVVEMRATLSLQESNLGQNLLQGRSDESLSAYWNSQDQIVANNKGSSTSEVVGILSITASSGVAQMTHVSVVVNPQSSAVVCPSSCPSSSLKTGVLTLAGNVFWVTSSESYGFDVALSNSSSSTVQGGTNATTVTLTSYGGYSQKVMLYAPNQPAGVNITFIPQIFTPTAVGAQGAMILNVTSSAVAGQYTIEVFAMGADSTPNNTVHYTLTIK
ncbi:MAG: hypothetical protein ABSE82_08560 [Nitrososphaerales archaeon]|jgi:hypothetical protein